jgi:hypothetical protein
MGPGPTDGTRFDRDGTYFTATAAADGRCPGGEYGSPRSAGKEAPAKRIGDRIEFTGGRARLWARSRRLQRQRRHRLALAVAHGDHPLVARIEHGLPTVLHELAAPSTPEEVRTEVAERVAAGQSVTSADVKELKSRIRERDEKLNKMRMQKGESDKENNALRRSLQEREERFQHLTHELDSLRETLLHTQQAEKANHEPVKAALVLLWNEAPEEVRAWFLQFVMKGPENGGSGGLSTASVN